MLSVVRLAFAVWSKLEDILAELYIIPQGMEMVEGILGHAVKSLYKSNSKHC